MKDKKPQTGFILFPTLIFSLLLVLIALYMMRGVFTDEKMASNTREKSRATEAAQSAINYAEWWLQQIGNATAGLGTTPCTGLSAVPVVLPITCTAPTLANVQTNTQLPAYTSYPLSANTNLTSASTTGGTNTYYADPTYAIYYLGTNAQGQLIYSIYALGYGGNAQAVAVVQSVFYVQIGTTSPL